MRVVVAFLQRHDRTSAALAYLGVLCLVYAPVVFFSKSLVPTLYYPLGVVPQASTQGRLPVNTFNVDLATPAYYEFPLNRLVGDMYRRGELPLWTPYLAAGKPLAAEYSVRAFFPYQVLEDLSPPSTWDFFLLGRLWFAALFTYMFLRNLGVSAPSAFAGGLFYMLGGATVWFINLEMLANTSMVIPLALYTAELALRHPKFLYTVPFSLAMTLTLLAGQPESTIYVLALVAGFLLLHAFHGRTRQQALWAVTRSGLGGLAGLFLSAPQVLIFLEFVPLSFNQHQPGTLHNGLAVIRFAESIGVLVPSYFTVPTFPREMPVNGYWDDLGGYTGVVMALLALVGVLIGHRLMAYQLLFMGFGLGILAKSFGYPLTYWVGAVPLFSSSWSQRWAGPVWVFSIACAAALSLEALATRHPSRQTWERWGNWLRYHAKQLGVLTFLLLAAAGGGFAFEGVGIGPGPSSVVCAGPMEQKCFRYLWWHAALLGIAWPGIVAWLLYRTAPFGERFPALYLRLWVATTCVVAVFQLLLTWFSDVTHSLLPPGDSYAIAARLGGGLVALAIAMLAVWLGWQCFRGWLTPWPLIMLAMVELWFWIPKGYDLVATWMTFVPLGLGLLAVLALVWRRYLLTAGMVILGVGAALLIDAMATHGLPDRRDPFRESTYVRFLQENLGEYRVFGIDGVLHPNFASIFQIQDVRYLNSLGIAEYIDYVREHLTDPHDVTWTPLWFPGVQERNYSGQEMARPAGAELASRVHAYSALGVKYILTPLSLDLRDTYLQGGHPGLPAPRLIYKGEVAIWENVLVHPRAFITHVADQAGSPQEAREAVGPRGCMPCPVADTRPFYRVRVEKPLAWVPMGTDGALDLHPRVEVARYRDTEVVLDAFLERPGLLVLTDTYYPGWQVKVNGQPGEVLRVNGVFRGVELPSGTHRVIFQYRPLSFALGVLVAGATLVLLALGVGAEASMPLWPRVRDTASRLIRYPARGLRIGG